ncbi:MAG TPA: sugar ABC transporter substrate-binding protein, partial [Roseiflexaceae bacterium]|nr:sugar ABC transporter substrate-binding protein [Roseiflexaceae bacterium]
MWHRKHKILVLISVIAGMILAACGGGAAPSTGGAAAPTAASGGAASGGAAPAASGDAVEIRYQLWDSNQQPPYQACADEFHKQNPNITVKIEQLGWDDYWSGIQTGMIGGTAPDVFTNHLAKYPEFASKGQLVDIQPLVDKDKVDVGQYIKGLADLWTRDGKRFGLPKDWDTVAIVYNGDMLEKAGVDPASLKDLTWNAQDGGTFGELIGKLTLDSNGKNGLDPAFDKTKVVQYGFVPVGGGGASGQTEWSWLAVANGFKFTDGPWATKYYYDDPKLAEAIQWYADLNLAKGFAPPLADYKANGSKAFFLANKAALTSDGSWTIGDYVKGASFKLGWAPLPKGPAGRKSMFNGLADSIWTGSKHQAEAWEWVKFASSKTCEDIVGKSGVVFP